MNIYLVNADFMERDMNAVVICEDKSEAIELAGYSGEGWSEQDVLLLGKSSCHYVLPRAISIESL